MGKEQKDNKKGELAISQTSRDNFVARFKKVNDTLFNNMKRDTWKVAHTAYSITQDKQYKKSFKNDKDFAETVGYTAGAMSKLITVAEIDLKYEVNRIYGLTTGQTQELIPLYRLGYASTSSLDFMRQFLDAYQDTFCTMTTKEIRQAVNDDMLRIAGDGETLTDEEVKSDDQDNEVNADDLAPDYDGEEVKDAVIKTSNEILHEIIGIIQQVNTCDTVLDYSTLKSAYSAIYTILESEELI